MSKLFNYFFETIIKNMDKDRFYTNEEIYKWFKTDYPNILTKTRICMILTSYNFIKTRRYIEVKNLLKKQKRGYILEKCRLKEILIKNMVVTDSKTP